MMRNKITDIGAIALAEALGVNSSVTHMNLRSNMIGCEGNAALAHVLTINSNIRDINIRTCTQY